MYKSFRVKNFRCFKDLQINDLGRVNLIAGKNNTGKTALLEAMYLLTKPLTSTVLLNLQKTRGLVAPEKNHASYIGQLFYRFDPSEAIEITGNSGMLSLGPRELRISELLNTSDNQWTFRDYYIGLREDGLGDFEAATRRDNTDACLQFSFKDETGEQRGLTLFLDRLVNSQQEVEQHSQFVAAQGRPDNQQIVNQFSHLDRSGKLSLLIDTLKHFDHRLSDLRLSQPYDELLICGRTNGNLIPLKLMGEGVNRACQFLLSLISDVDYVFIDEIENGIHYSVQKDVWKAIGQVARELEIQVFATTHSYEMIKAAYEAFVEDETLDEFRYHRLYRDKTTRKIEARTYNEFGVDAAISSEYEVRG